MISKIDIEYLNFDESKHKNFPIISDCVVYSKGNIINVDIGSLYVIKDVSDDVNYDSFGRNINISYGQWRHEESGQQISLEEFYQLEEKEVYEYNFVSAALKLYTKNEYRVSYGTCFDKKIRISLIPVEILEFSSRNCDSIVYQISKNNK